MAVNPDVMAGYGEMVHCLDKYVEAEQFYDGQIGSSFGSPRVQILMNRMNIGRVEDFNFAAIPVDTVVNKLKITTLTVATYDGEKHDEAQRILQEGWRRNKMQIETDGLHHGAAEYGDYYAIVWPVMDAEGKKVIGWDFVRESPKNMRVFYNQDGTKNYAMKWWMEEEGGKKVFYSTLYYRDRIEFWMTNKGTDPKIGESWIKRQDDKENPYGQVPVFHFRTSTSTKYGLPEHYRAYGPQRFINRVVSNFSVSIDFQSFPQRYALMDAAADQPMGNSSDPFNPEDVDEDPEEEGSSGLSADPAAVWRLFGMKGVGQFNPADPENFIKPMSNAVKSMAQLTQTPFHYFDPSGDVPSGESLRTANEPLYTRAERLQMLFESEYDDAFSFALTFFGIEDVVVDVKWKAVRMVADKEGWDTLTTKVSLGVPLKQALQEAGYADELVESWLKEGSDVTARVNVLKTIAEVIESLGASMTTGVIQEAQVKKLVADLIGDVEGTSEDEEV